MHVAKEPSGSEMATPSRIGSILNIDDIDKDGWVVSDADIVGEPPGLTVVPYKHTL